MGTCQDLTDAQFFIDDAAYWDTHGNQHYVNVDLGFAAQDLSNAIASLDQDVIQFFIAVNNQLNGIAASLNGNTDALQQEISNDEAAINWITQSLIPQVQAMLTADMLGHVVPLQENLGHLQTQVDLMPAQVETKVKTDLVDPLDRKVEAGFSGIINGLIPQLALQTGTLCNQTKRAVTQLEECCDENAQGNRNNASQLANILRCLGPWLPLICLANPITLAAVGGATFALGPTTMVNALGDVVGTAGVEMEHLIEGFLGV